MIGHLWPWAALTLAGVVLAVLQLGDGVFVSRPEVRMPLFLGGSLVAVAGLLKFIAVATDPELRRRNGAGSTD